jgi:hypothetical protein
MLPAGANLMDEIVLKPIIDPAAGLKTVHVPRVDPVMVAPFEVAFICPWCTVTLGISSAEVIKGAVVACMECSGFSTLPEG